MKSAFGCLAWVAVVLIIVGLVVKYFFVDVAVVGHNAMAPTMLSGERVLIWKTGEPDLGAIAVCEHPTEEGMVVGRVVATGDMSISTRRGTLHIDGEPIDVNLRHSTTFYDADEDAEETRRLAIEYLAEGKDYMVFQHPQRPAMISATRVPPDHVYLLSDDRGYPAGDSRSFGPVPVEDCHGTVFMRVTPEEGLESELEHGHFELLK